METPYQSIIYEELKVGMLLTGVSGYLDSYTYLTHGEHFASLQSGNLILMGGNLADGKWAQAATYLLPILFFMLGSAASFQIKRFAGEKHLHRHFLATMIEFIGMTIVAVLSFFLPDLVTVALFGFFAAIQADTFSKLRGMPYATVMSTGNLKSFASFIYGGLTTNDKGLLTKGRNAGAVVLSFFIGAFLSVFIYRLIGNFSVFGITIILAIILCMIRTVEHEEAEL